MAKDLVAYFSASGVTARAAQAVAAELGADTYEIRPQVPYTAADLNWQDKQSRSSVEMADKASRPALAAQDAPVADHGTVYLGFPIWWYTAPTIVNSFLESYDFGGKRIVLFATAGSSGFGNTAADLQKSAPGATFVEGKVFTGKLDESAVKSWAAGLKK